MGNTPPSAFFQHIPGSPSDLATTADVNALSASVDAKYGGVDRIAVSPLYSLHVAGSFGGGTYNTIRIPGVTEITQWSEWIVEHYVNGNGSGYAAVIGSWFTGGADPPDTLKGNLVPLGTGLLPLDVSIYLYIVGRP